jgi:hypothetical protein
MARETLRAHAIGLQNRLVGVGRFVLHPGQQGGPEVEADARVVVDDFCDAAFRVQNARGAVGRVAFRRDALVPIVIGSGGILQLDRLQPRILARRLIEVAVNAKISVVVHRSRVQRA